MWLPYVSVRNILKDKRCYIENSIAFQHWNFTPPKKKLEKLHGWSKKFRNLVSSCCSVTDFQLKTNHFIKKEGTQNSRFDGGKKKGFPKGCIERNTQETKPEKCFPLPPDPSPYWTFQKGLCHSPAVKQPWGCFSWFPAVYRERTSSSSQLELMEDVLGRRTPGIFNPLLISVLQLVWLGSCLDAFSDLWSQYIFIIRSITTFIWFSSMCIFLGTSCLNILSTCTATGMRTIWIFFFLISSCLSLTKRREMKGSILVCILSQQHFYS